MSELKTNAHGVPVSVGAKYQHATGTGSSGVSPAMLWSSAQQELFESCTATAFTSLLWEFSRSVGPESAELRELSSLTPHSSRIGRSPAERLQREYLESFNALLEAAQGTVRASLRLFDGRCLLWVGHEVRLVGPSKSLSFFCGDDRECRARLLRLLLQLTKLGGCSLKYLRSQAHPGNLVAVSPVGRQEMMVRSLQQSGLLSPELHVTGYGEEVLGFVDVVTRVSSRTVHAG